MKKLVIITGAPGVGKRQYAVSYSKQLKDVHGLIQTGAGEVRLYVADDNVPAQELYKKCGLKVDGKAIYMRSEHD